MIQLRTPTTTVATPSYNVEKFIDRTIQSILNQACQDCELLAIYDCPTDSKLEVVVTYTSQDTRTRRIALDKNHGTPAAPRNIGVREVKGYWIAFLLFHYFSHDQDLRWLDDQHVHKHQAFDFHPDNFPPLNSSPLTIF